MKSIRVLLPALTLVLFWFVSGCQPAELTDAEFASVIMRTVVDKGYVGQNAKAAAIYDRDGLTITLNWADSDLSDGQATAQFTVSFANYETEGSVINGGFQAEVTISAAGGELHTLKAVFDTGGGALAVTGKHSGEYQFVNAAVVYDFATGDYTYSGVVFVDGVEHTL